MIGNDLPARAQTPHEPHAAQLRSDGEPATVRKAWEIHADHRDAFKALREVGGFRVLRQINRDSATIVRGHICQRDKITCPIVSRKPCVRDKYVHCGAPKWMPHSVLVWSRHRPARAVSPDATRVVHGVQPTDGKPLATSG